MIYIKPITNREGKTFFAVKYKGKINENSYYKRTASKLD